MKEFEILSTIKSIIGDKYIGDDCAYLKDLGIVISQDSLVEDVHFCLKYISAYQLGYKSAMVNISDIAASGGEPKYMTIALSLPKNVSNEFVREFYNGAKTACKGVEIVGGDITGSDKIMISVTVLGTTKGRKISSRSGAKTNYAIVTSGVHGSSAGGLKLLFEGKSSSQKLIDAHLMPKAQVEFASTISRNIDVDYAMMDTSDGLADALYKIAQSSNKTLVVDFDIIAYDKELSEEFPQEYKNMIMYGGEDYQIVAVVPKEFVKDIPNCFEIGYVKDKQKQGFVEIHCSNDVKYLNNTEKCFNHFE